MECDKTYSPLAIFAGHELGKRRIWGMREEIEQAFSQPVSSYNNTLVNEVSLSRYPILWSLLASSDSCTRSFRDCKPKQMRGQIYICLPVNTVATMGSHRQRILDLWARARSSWLGGHQHGRTNPLTVFFSRTYIYETSMRAQGCSQSAITMTDHFLSRLVYLHLLTVNRSIDQEPLQ